MFNRSEIAFEGSGWGLGDRGGLSLTLLSCRVRERALWVSACRERHGLQAERDSTHSTEAKPGNLMRTLSASGVPSGSRRGAWRGTALIGRRPDRTRWTRIMPHAAFGLRQTVSRLACNEKCSAEREAISCW